jgi:hypothetical protein
MHGFAKVRNYKAPKRILLKRWGIAPDRPQSAASLVFSPLNANPRTLMLAPSRRPRPADHPARGRGSILANRWLPSLGIPQQFELNLQTGRELLLLLLFRRGESSMKANASFNFGSQFLFSGLERLAYLYCVAHRGHSAPIQLSFFR